MSNSSSCISSVNLIPFYHLLIQGASGIGASIYFKLNSSYIISSSIFGIIFGGFINGIENESFTFNVGRLCPIFNYIVPNKLQSLFFNGKGSKNKSLLSLKKVSNVFESDF